MTNLLIEPHIERGNLLGRSPYEGYQRGAGLRFTDLPQKISNELDYGEAFALADGRTVVSHIRLMNLYLLVRFFLPRLNHGHIIEFGSYRGGSALFMAKLAERYLPGVNVYALDTFEGMPATDKNIDAHNAGDFTDTSFSEVSAAASRAGLRNLHLVKGLFDQTTDGVVAECGAISLAHIDCDIYHPAIYAFEQVKTAMVPGGYVVFDDATEASCLGATQAVEDIICRYNLRSEQIDPHFVLRYPPLP